jgi:hypothetical protein
MTRDSQALTILQRSMCLTLSCHYLGNSRKVELDPLELRQRSAPPVTDLDGEVLLDAPPDDDEAARTLRTDQLLLSKKLVDPAVLRAPMRVIGRAKSYLRGRAISAHRVFGTRTYLVPSALTLEVDEALEALRRDLAAAVEPVAVRWTEIVAEQAVTLGPLFRAADYKTADEVRAAFGIDWDYVRFDAPENLETVSRALFESSRDRWDRRFSAAYDEVRLVLRETLRQLVAEIARKLEPREDGRPPIIRPTLLAPLVDFLGTFDARNIADDGELAAVAERIRGLMQGVSLDALRGDDGQAFREAVRGSMQGVTEQLDGLVATGRRAFRFGEAA